MCLQADLHKNFILLAQVRRPSAIERGGKLETGRPENTLTPVPGPRFLE